MAVQFYVTDLYVVPVLMYIANVATTLGANAFYMATVLRLEFFET